MEIDDELLLEAKAVALKRRTSLKAIVEHALRREIYSESFRYSEAEDKCFEVSEDGLPRLKGSGKKKVTSEFVYKLMEEEGI
jgi:hypothetical protein